LLFGELSSIVRKTKGTIMGHEILLEGIKTELEQLDAAALQALREIIDRVKRPRFLAPETAGRPTMPLIDIEGLCRSSVKT
jgi:hypothetical protein